jgi:hypothetical protein
MSKLYQFVEGWDLTIFVTSTDTTPRVFVNARRLENHKTRAKQQKNSHTL